jgi:homoserine acetyltransferase
VRGISKNAQSLHRGSTGSQFVTVTQPQHYKSHFQTDRYLSNEGSKFNKLMDFYDTIYVAASS